MWLTNKSRSGNAASQRDLRSVSASSIVHELNRYDVDAQEKKSDRA
jgi:hypothetical protein